MKQAIRIGGWGIHSVGSPKAAHACVWVVVFVFLVGADEFCRLAECVLLAVLRHLLFVDIENNRQAKRLRIVFCQLHDVIRKVSIWRFGR